MRTTQEYLSAPRPELQDEVTINGKSFWADRELIPLLRALNEAGLVTRSHCSGHGIGPAWIVIRADNIVSVEVRRDATYNELVLTWHPAADESQAQQIEDKVAHDAERMAGISELATAGRENAK